MNIFISIDNLGIGGAQKFVLSLAKELSKKHNIYIFSHANHKQKIQEATFIYQLPDNIKIIYFPFILHLIKWLAFKIDYLILNKIKINLTLCRTITILFLRQEISRHKKIDIINSHLFYSDSVVVNALSNLKIPIIVTDHGDYRNVTQHGDYTWDDVSNVLEQIDGIIYPCQYNAKYLSKKIKNVRAKQAIIYNGFPMEDKKIYPELARQKLGISENALVFGMVARGIPDKGWAEAIQAFDLLRKSLKEKGIQKDIHLILVGGDDYLASLQRHWEPKLINSIHFVGYSSDPNYWVESFNVGLLPTYLIGESLPYSIIEYLAAGKPVIATKVGGIHEMMNYNRQIPGCLINLNQDGKADVFMILDAMLRYVNDYELLERHSLLAKQSFKKFDMQTCVEAYEFLFKTFLSQVSTGSNGKGLDVY